MDAPEQEKVGIVRDWNGNHYQAERDISLAALLGITRIFHFGSYGFGPGERGEIDQWGRNWYLEDVDGQCHRHGVDIFITPGEHDILSLPAYAESDRLPLQPHGTRHQLIAPTDAVTRFAEELARPRSDRLEVVWVKNR
ncbi:hypothetical protein [Subtercola vilae]|uniref:Uncharacterized protein n=1 Tax=Subtercola vilae TaxID=2056433 RepID=A0A4T2BPY4_9MICO|nr:hypothetical protein [Subtercola vilae]TIH32281.1 hypothetical protein D4765_15685 [Subtercola vilae]